MPKVNTVEDFINRAVAVHGTRYDYGHAEYRGFGKNLTIICREHGPFQQTPTNHYRGSGCPACGRLLTVASRKLDIDDFIKKAKAVHGDKYSYEQAVYDGTKKKIQATCKLHGPFLVTVENHYKGVGCTICNNLKRVESRTIKYDKFLLRANTRHSGKYTYNQESYCGTKHTVKILCAEHGEFSQRAAAHLNGAGCPECSVISRSTNQIMGKEEFIRSSKKIHKQRYDYSQVDYHRSQTKVTVICSEHGEFQTTPDNHLRGHGCSRCGVAKSQVEERLGEFLSHFTQVKKRVFGILGGKREIDILIPGSSLALEYNGSVWHSEKFHPKARTHLRDKQEECAALGIRLIQAFDYQNETVIRKTLVHILGLDDEKYYARQCDVSLVDPDKANLLLERNHLQGGVRGCTHYGLMVRGSLVAVMSFSLAKSERGSSDPGRWELRRFSSVCRVVGGASKLLKTFTRNTPDCESLISYSDNAWFTGKMYENLGFKLVKELAPDYRYVKSNLIRSKSSFQRKKLATMQGFDFNPEESEYQNCLRNKWFRIWGCGKKKWELRCK